MMTQNFPLSDTLEGKIQKTEQNFNRGLALVGLSRTGPWIPVVSGIPDSLRQITDSNAQDFGFYEQKFPGIRNPDYLKWGELLVSIFGG